MRRPCERVIGGTRQSAATESQNEDGQWNLAARSYLNASSMHFPQGLTLLSQVLEASAETDIALPNFTHANVPVAQLKVKSALSSGPESEIKSRRWDCAKDSHKQEARQEWRDSRDRRCRRCGTIRTTSEIRTTSPKFTKTVVGVLDGRK